MILLLVQFSDERSDDISHGKMKTVNVTADILKYLNTLTIYRYQILLKHDGGQRESLSK